MRIAILMELEMKLKFNIYEQQKELEAVKSIKGLLQKIDYNAEVIPSGNLEEITKLLASLKGEKLTLRECELIEKVLKTK